MAEPIILCDTEGMTEDEWLACRAHGPNGDLEYTIGGSDVPVILGLSKWATPLDLYKIKKGEMAPPPKKNKKQLEMGKKLEQIAADLYEEKTGDTVINDTFLYQHADLPYALANFDRRIIRKNVGTRGILEIRGLQLYLRLGLGVYHKYLMCKPLTHPLDTFEVDLHLIELLETVAESFRLRTGHRCLIKNIL